MDPKLKERKTILVFYNLALNEGDKLRFSLALKSWAISGEMLLKTSLAIVFTSSLYNIIDEETNDLIINIEVKSGEPSEYSKLVSHVATELNVNLKDGGVIAKAIKGLNLHQAEAILVESYALKGGFDLEQIKISKGNLVKKTGVLEIEEPKEGFESIGGYKAVKDFIKQKIIDISFKKREKAGEFGVPLPRGILFFGPPGTGKTLFAKALAKEIEYPFINMKTENLYRRHLGETGERLKSAIRTAEQMSPAIVFIDEIDRFGKRTQPQDGAGEETRKAFSQLLEWLGDKKREAIIIGTTNEPNHLDEAFIRTGRFDYKIPILYPDEDARLAILCIHLGLPDSNDNPSPMRQPPLALSVDQFTAFLRREIVPYTKDYTGAELEELVNRAKRVAVEKDAENIQKEHFITSLSSFRIDPSKREEQKTKYENLAREYCDDEIFLGQIFIKSLKKE